MIEWKNKYNSFNGAKSLVHVNYWKCIKDGIIPPPVSISIDPCSTCNFNCPHCNAAEILNKMSEKMSVETIDILVDKMVQWKTKSACIAGGGESLLNENSYYLIDKLHRNKIQIAVITNGSTLNKNPNSILKCNYVGVSVDAATDATYKKIKNCSFPFDKLINNIQSITRKGLQVTYKYLLLPDNTEEVYEACKIAKEIGCDQFHMRPGSATWFNTSSYDFTEQQINSVNEQMAEAREKLESEKFRIFGILSKFDDKLKYKLSFNQCWACFTTFQISANGNIGLCCDRRGDELVSMGNIKDIDSLWGSDKHKKIFQSIDVTKCPRCTLAHVNEIFENVVIEDKMFYNFI